MVNKKKSNFCSPINIGKSHKRKKKYKYVKQNLDYKTKF